MEICFKSISFLIRYITKHAQNRIHLVGLVYIEEFSQFLFRFLFRDWVVWFSYFFLVAWF